jgi:peptidoglycan L-alanyl-D-glutamate endopeptidase CwlK
MSGLVLGVSTIFPSNFDLAGDAKFLTAYDKTLSPVSIQRTEPALTERTMFLFSMLLFFVLTCFCAWLLLFPAGRELLAQAMGAIGRRIELHVRGGYRHGVEGAHGLGRGARGAVRMSVTFLRRRYLLILSAAVLVIVPTMLALMLSGRGMLGAYDSDSQAVNDQVADLLKGELLAPPAPLPPLIFTTAEVTLVRPMLDSANRNWRLLDPAFAQRLLTVFKIMKEQHGYDMAILEGYRSPERQNALALSGPSVTNAKAFQSYHQFGLAADCAFLRDGKLVISERDPWAMRGYRLYGEAAEAAGLTWGGRWTMMDFGHTELRVPGTVKK